jgi:hypothetical protein
VVAYLVSLDQLFDEQGRLLREQISRAEQAESTVWMHQVRVAQVEARTATPISSETVAHESLRRIQDQHMQEWTNSGTPVPAIGEAQVLLGTPLVGWGGTIETPPTPPAVTEQPTETAVEETSAQPQENGNLEGEDDDGLLIPLEVHSASEDGSPHG